MQWHLGTRKDFTLYDLQAFTPEYAHNNWPKPVSSNQMCLVPRGQETRWQRFRDFYKTTDAAKLKQKKKNLVATWVAQSRQVVFLIPPSLRLQEQNDLGASLNLDLLKEWDIPGIGRWALYSVNSVLKP